MSEQVDSQVQLALYRITAESGSVPDSGEIAGVTGLTEPDVRDAFQRLYAKRLLVLEPDDPARVRMAPPFAGMETAFPVEANGKRYYANCVWDAYGVAAALHADAVIPARDGYSSEALTLEIKNGQPVMHPYVAHFAVPAAHWWDNIVYT